MQIVKRKSTGLQKRNVVLSNTLIRSAQGLSLVEKRILMAAIAQMGNSFKTVRISAIDYAETYGVSPKNAYKQLKEASQNFRKRYITFAEQDRQGTKLNWEINWLSAIAYENNLGYILIDFNPNLMPYLCDLMDQFTIYQLKQSAALRSIYSWRMLELFEQMKNEKTQDGWLIIKLHDFLNAMDAKPTHRNNFGEARRKLIEPALKELQEKDGWNVEWQAIKDGRKINMLKFCYSRIMKVE